MPTFSEDVEQLEFSYTAGRSEIWHNYFENA